MMRPVLFAAKTGSNPTQPQQNPERLVNMFAERDDGLSIRSVPGLKELVKAGDGRVRSMVSTPDVMFIAVGGRLVSWDDTALTTLAPIPDGFTTMAFNANNELAIAANGEYLVWDGTDLISPSGGAFAGVSAVDYVDGYTVRTQKDGSAWDVTGINNAKSLDALDFAGAEYKIDRLLRSIVSSGFVWNMGEETIEPWQNSGGADFPFSRLESTIIEKGLRSASEVAEVDNTIFWVSNEGRAYMARELTAQKVSTTAIDAILASGTGGECFVYQYQSHDFAVVRFNNQPAVVYDPSTDFGMSAQRGLRS